MPTKYKLLSPEQYMDPTNFLVDEIPLKLAKPIIIKNHYSRKWSPSKISFGVYEISKMGADKNQGLDGLIGVAVYGLPVGRSVISGISHLLKQDEVLELKRLWIADGHGYNIESWAIRKTFFLLKSKMPKVKVLVSYADPAAGHHGGIYQAGNWLYQDLNIAGTPPATFSVSLKKSRKAEEWIHSRTIGRRFQNSNVEALKRWIGQDFWIKPDSIKNRYLQFLCHKIDKKKIIASLKHPISPYKKESNYSVEIKKISVNRAKLYPEAERTTMASKL